VEVFGEKRSGFHAIGQPARRSWGAGQGVFAGRRLGGQWRSIMVNMMLLRTRGDGQSHKLSEEFESLELARVRFPGALCLSIRRSIIWKFSRP
jgi:hypothetical protein